MFFENSVENYLQLFFREELNTKLQNIKYINMKITANDIFEEICPYVAENDDSDVE